MGSMNRLLTFNVAGNGAKVGAAVGVGESVVGEGVGVVFGGTIWLWYK